MARRDGRPGVFAQFFTGVGYLGRGFGVWRTAPGLMLLGMVPAAIVGALVVAGIIALGLNLEAIATAVTPFAENWDEPWRGITRLAAGFAFLAFAILIVMLTFTTVTLIVGAPFYELIWRHVESRYGEPPHDERGFWRTLGKGIVDGLRMLLPTIFVGLALFLLGLIPLVGQVLAIVIGALVGGWFLAVELVGTAFDARGKSLRERRATLKTLRPMTVGFGTATYLLFLIPLGAVLTMPAAVAGATLLARRELEEDVSAVARAAASRTTSSLPD